MAKASEITVDINVTVSDETIGRCIHLLEMWMDDNSNKYLVVDKIPYTDGYHHKIRIEEWKTDNAGD